MKLPNNMGNTDRVIRALAALIILVLSLMQVISGVWATVAIVVAVILLATSLIGYCPLYSLLRISSRRI